MAARSIEELQKRYASLGKTSGGRGGPGPRKGGPGAPRPKGKPKNSRATVGRLLGYIGAYWFRLAFVLLCMLCSTVASMVGTYLLRDVYNVLTLPAAGEVSAHTKSILLKIFMPDLVANATPTPEQRLGCLGIILTVLALIYLTGIISTYLQGRLMIAVSQNAVEKIRNDLFKKLQKLPVRYFDSHPTGELMSRFTNDVDAIDMMINSTVTGLISGAISLAGTVFMMFYTSWFLAIITLLFVPLYLFGGGLIAKRSAKYHVAQQTALGAVNGYIEETVTGSKVVKVFNHEEDCVTEFETLNNDMRDKQFKAQFYGGVLGPVMHNISGLAFALTAGVGGLLCIFAGFDVGGLTVFCNYSRQFSMPINNISMQITTVFSALAGAERVFAVMDATPEAPDLPDAVGVGELRGEVVLEERGKTSRGNYSAIVTSPLTKTDLRLISLLEGIGYTGIANFDLLRGDGGEVCLELNPRQGRSFDYMRAAGINLANMIVDEMCGAAQKPHFIYKEGFWREASLRTVVMNADDPALLARAVALEREGNGVFAYDHVRGEGIPHKIYVALRTARCGRRFAKYKKEAGGYAPL